MTLLYIVRENEAKKPFAAEVEKLKPSAELKTMHEDSLWEQDD